VEAFAAYLRRIEVTPNGHKNATKRRLLTKGVQYVLETCRTMYTYAVKRRHLPPYVGNPFSELPLDKMKIEDAKPIFVFTADTELKFPKACSDWAFPVYFTLAKTGLRVGELVHLLIEDVDLTGGWLHVRNKIELGWRVKTGQERTVPLLAEVVAVFRAVIGKRICGPVFLREKFHSHKTAVIGDRRELEKVLRDRRADEGRPLTRTEEAALAKKLWWDAGAVKADKIRQVFGRVTAAIGCPESTCPKSWRHTFATLLQDANVDPLIRQQVMGHKPTFQSGLDMTANYNRLPSTLVNTMSSTFHPPAWITRKWPSTRCRRPAPASYHDPRNPTSRVVALPPSDSCVMSNVSPESGGGAAVSSSTIAYIRGVAYFFASAGVPAALNRRHAAVAVAGGACSSTSDTGPGRAAPSADVRTASSTFHPSAFTTTKWPSTRTRRPAAGTYVVPLNPTSLVSGRGPSTSRVHSEASFGSGALSANSVSSSGCIRGVAYFFASSAVFAASSFLHTSVAVSGRTHSYTPYAAAPRTATTTNKNPTAAASASRSSFRSVSLGAVGVVGGSGIGGGDGTAAGGAAAVSTGCAGDFAFSAGAGSGGLLTTGPAAGPMPGVWRSGSQVEPPTGHAGVCQLARPAASSA
jgi:integrase